MRVLITGAAGFIGFHLCLCFLRLGYQVVGLDNLNPYYSPELKRDRLARLREEENFDFSLVSLEDQEGLEELFRENAFSHVLHMAAQAGVRYSLSHPRTYVNSNLVGFENILECCRHHAPLKHLVFASSSSVYGLNTKMPFSEHDNVDHPVSLYAATKKANELMAHSYSYLYSIPCTGLRFFTVYGPWGRPDMAYFRFTDAILNDKPISVFNYGRMRRDFTYIDDVVDGVYKVTFRPPEPAPDWSGEDPDPATSSIPYRIYNIGNNQSVELERFIGVLEQCLGKRARKDYEPLQPGDVPSTYADIDDLARDVGYSPETTIEEGLPQFVDWYKAYYRSGGP
jgi:UDP-glucuronate 4-epimerase